MPTEIKKLIKRISLVLLPFLVLFIVILLFTPYITGLQKAKVQDKVQKLILNASTTPPVIIGGDSRAEANIMPILFTHATQLSSVNIASGNETLSQLYQTLSNNHLLNQKKIIIASVSIYQINDLANDYQPIDKMAIDTEPWRAQKIGDEIKYWKSYIDYYIDRYKGFLRFDFNDSATMDPAEFQTAGYEAVYTLLPLPNNKAQISGDPFEPYDARFRISGLKQKEFIETIAKFGATNDTIVIYLGPLAPLWKENMTDQSVQQNDAFAQLIKNAAAPYPNVHFVNFEESDTISTLPNQDFSDYVHLNTTGATTFTQLLTDSLKRQNIIK